MSDLKPRADTNYMVTAQQIVKLEHGLLSLRDWNRTGQSSHPKPLRRPLMPSPQFNTRRSFDCEPSWTPLWDLKKCPAT